MPTAAELAGGTSVLWTVVQLVEDAIIFQVFGFSREHLRRLLEAGSPALASLVEKGWEAVLMDPTLTAMPQHLLGIASREEIAKELSQVLARSPYYTGTAKATVLAHQITANSVVTRAAYYQFEASTIRRVTSLMTETLGNLMAAADPMVRKIIDRLEATPASVRERVIMDLAERRGGYATYAAQMDSALQQWQKDFARIVTEDAEAAKRLGFQRAVDTMYHFEDARNPWSKLSQPLSAMELGTILHTFRGSVLPIAAERVIREARGLSEQIRRRISSIITKEVFIKGGNPRAAAAQILKEFKTQLGERWGGPKVSAIRMARTETAYVLNESTRLAYQEMGVRWVDVIYTEAMVPCHICPEIAHGGPYLIDHVPEGGIPFHPNCRCTYCAAFPKDAIEDMKPIAKVIGAKNWVLELAKAGFAAVGARQVFGTTKPSNADRTAVRDVLADFEAMPDDDEEALGIERSYQHRRIVVRGYRRIEPKTFPLPATDTFREVQARDPVRAIYDLRKNLYEIGGMIRGNRIYYYKGGGGSVAIQPILDAVGGLHPGDILFHTHPMALTGGVQSTIPSPPDLRLHLWASTQGDRLHYIVGPDGVRQIRAVVTDKAKWDRFVFEQWFVVTILLAEETYRGSYWWLTQGIRRFLARLKEMDVGGYLEVSEPAQPNAEFVPLAPYNIPTRVSPQVTAELERRTAVQLRDLYAEVAAQQGAPLFRDLDYYRGLLESLDPHRDWHVAVTTKDAALKVLREQGVAVTGTRFTREEIISHLTGQKVFGKVYLDTAKIDYEELLGVSNLPKGTPVDTDFIGDVAKFMTPKDLDTVFDHLVAVHGVPATRERSVLVAILENSDPRTDFYGMPSQEIEEAVTTVDFTRPKTVTGPLVGEHDPRGTLPLAPWSEWEKRQIVAGRIIYGLDLVPDPSVVWWGLWFPGFPEAAPQITPLLGTRTKVPTPEGPDPWIPKVRYSNRHRFFKDEWGIDLKETAVTLPWDPPTLRELDLALHLIPEVARAVRTASRYSGDTFYDPVLQRLVVGSEPNLQKTLLALADALVLKVLRVGYRDERGLFHGDPSRTPILRDWLGVEPWRYRAGGLLLHPGTPEGSSAALAGKGSWVQPSSAYSDSDPSASLALSIAVYVLGGDLLPAVRDFMRTRIFGGDTFKIQQVDFADGSKQELPVRHRRTERVSLA